MLSALCVHFFVGVGNVQEACIKLMLGDLRRILLCVPPSLLSTESAGKSSSIPLSPQGPAQPCVSWDSEVGSSRLRNSENSYRFPWGQSYWQNLCLFQALPVNSTGTCEPLGKGKGSP